MKAYFIEFNEYNIFLPDFHDNLSSSSLILNMASVS
jgi:hypothetical protein